MTNRPTLEELLAAVRRFVAVDLRDTLSDRRLKYRALIAANLLDQVRAELARARPGNPPDDTALDLARRIRADELGPVELAAARRELLADLGRELAVANPSFDTTIDLP